VQSPVILSGVEGDSHTIGEEQCRCPVKGEQEVA
jgi:hypothetical protein